MRSCLFYSLCLVFLLISAVKAEVYTTTDGYQFEVLLIPDKSEIMIGEPVYLSFEVRNLSEVDLSFPEGGDYRNRLGRPESYKIQATRIDGKEVPVPKIDMSFGGLVGQYRLKKNDGVKVFRLFLPLWSQFEEIGEYNISCSKYLGITNDEKKPENLRFSSKDGITVAVKTKIKVVKKDAVKLGEIISYWGAELSNTSTWERSHEALKALEYIDDERIETPLIKAVKDEKDFGAKGSAIRLLAKFNGDDSFNAIISQFKHPTNSIRIDVVKALSVSQYLKAFDYLLKFKDDKDKFVRLAVMQALGRKGTPESIEIINEMLLEERNKELYEYVKPYLEKPKQ